MLSKYKPNKNLIKNLKQHAGRNNKGRITVAHRGGGHKKLYRQIAFNRDYFKAIVDLIEYDPARSAFIAHLSYKEKKKKKLYYSG
jgi:large subunit ribosomal protein L2